MTHPPDYDARGFLVWTGIFLAAALLFWPMCGCVGQDTCPALDEGAIYSDTLLRFEAHAKPLPAPLPYRVQYVSGGDFNNLCHGPYLLGCGWWSQEEKLWRVQVLECRPEREMVDTLAHEFTHAMLGVAFGDVDHDHNHEVWGTVAVLRSGDR